MADPPEGDGREGEGDGGGSGGDGDHGGGDGAGHDDLKQAIREVLAEMGVSVGGSGDGAGSAGEGGEGPPAGGGRMVDQERYFEGLVRNVLAELKDREDVSNLREEVKKIVERPPRKYRRSTQLMGWVGADDE